MRVLLHARVGERKVVVNIIFPSVVAMGLVLFLGGD